MLAVLSSLLVLALALIAFVTPARAGHEAECYGATCWPRCWRETCNQYDDANRERQRELRLQLRELRNQWLRRGDDPTRPTEP